MEQDEIDLVLRALALRKTGSIGVLWAEGGRYWISTSEFDLYESRQRVSLAALHELVEQCEAAAREHGRRPPNHATSVENAKKTCA